MSNPSLILPQSPAYGEDYVYAAQVEDGAVPLYNVLPLTFTRASGGTRINKDGLVQNMPYNLVAQSESIGTSPWLLNGATLTSGQTDPSGGTTAVKVELASGGNNYVYQGIPFTNPINIVSAYLRADSATTIGFSVGGSTPNAVNLTTTWQLFTFSSTDTSGGIIFDNYFGPSPTQQAKTFYVWHPQLNIGSTAQPYLATTDRLNMPRITYPVGGGCGALLLEPQRTNLVTYSEQFNNAAWSLSDLTITANNAISPDGTQNADLISSTSSVGLAYQVKTLSGLHTISAFFKAGTSVLPRLQFYDSGAGTSGIGSYNLSTQSVSTSGLSSTGTITSCGNGWYRCTLTANLSGSSINCFIGVDENAKNLLAWGAQVEASSYPTSYIPTTSSTATRVADACYKTGISSLIGQTEGTLFADIELNLAGSNVGFYALQVYDSASSPTYTKAAYIELYQGKVYGYVRNTTVQCEIISSTYADNTRLKIAIAYKANDFALYVNGVQIGTDTSGSLPSVLNSLALHYSASSQQGSPLHQAIIFQTRLTNAELATLTTI
jgi:hypothetical protein